MTTRQDKVSDLIKDEVCRLLLREVRDPRIGFVTVTGATVSPDLRSVVVFVSVLGEPAVREGALKGLNSAAGFFKRSLFHNLRLRYAPAVSFRLDDSLERGERIDRVLRTIQEQARTGKHADEEE